MKWKLGKATCQSQWIDVILFSLVPLIDVHVGWISSATHDPDKPREPPVVVEVAVIEVVNAAAQRIGAGERERQRSIHVYRLNLSMKRQVGGDGDGDDVASRGRTAHAHVVVVHAGPSRIPSQPAHMLPHSLLLLLV